MLAAVGVEGVSASNPSDLSRMSMSRAMSTVLGDAPDDDTLVFHDFDTPMSIRRDIASSSTSDSRIVQGPLIEPTEADPWAPDQPLPTTCTLPFRQTKQQPPCIVEAKTYLGEDYVVIYIVAESVKEYTMDGSDNILETSEPVTCVCGDWVFDLVD